MTRKTLLIVALCAAALLSAAGIAYAVIPDGSGQYTACMLKATGTIRMIDKSASPSSLLSHCTSLETGDAHCANGGAAITDAGGNTAYVCNGTDGQDFAGTFTSPNGQYKLEVADTGILLQAPGGKVRLDATSTRVEASASLELNSSGIAKLEGSGGAQVLGAMVQLNGCSRSLVGVGDQVLITQIGTFGPIQPPGFPTVCAG
jgi:hypothetical protein